MYSYNMKDPDVIIVKQLTHAECLNKDRLVLIKYIIARMADLNPFPPKCSESLKYDHEIYDRIEEKLLQSYKCEMIDILKSENELRMICNDVKKEILRESIDPFNDDDMSDISDVSDISDISDIESDDGMKIDKHDNKSQKLINSDVANVMRELTRSRNSIVKMKFCFVFK